MKVQKIKLSQLKRPENNVRMHTDKQITEFQRSVKMFGQIRPIVVDENNVIMAGNGLYETLLSLDYTDADCYVVSGLNEKEKKKLMLADNRIFNLGVDDMVAFDQIIAELGDDLDVPGYDEDLLKSLSTEDLEIDSLMSDYGKIGDDKKGEIIAAKERYEKEAEKLGENSEQAADVQSEPQNSDVAQQRRSVVCPKCGERIWL